MFSVNFVSGLGERMYAKIVKEGSRLVYGSADDIEGVYNTGSAMVITACSAQEQVWVKSSITGRMYGHYSYFTGFLLYPGF